jgi:hypothetical protein
MEFLRAIIGIIVIITVAVLLGRLDHHKHPKAFTYCCISSIFVLFFLGYFL